MEATRKVTRMNDKAILKHLYPLISLVTRQRPLAAWPWLYFPYAKMFRRFKPGAHNVAQRCLPDENTNLVIEGPGSGGNHSFAAYFRKWNPSERVSTLTHCAATVRYAVKRGIPCVVLSRDIMGYINSHTKRFPHLYTPGVAARCYTSFFLSVWDYRAGFVLAQLHEIIDRPDMVIRQINAQFGTVFNAGDGLLPRIRVSEGDPNHGYEDDGK